MLWAFLLSLLLLCPVASAAGPSDYKTVVVLYPDTDTGRPAHTQLNRAIRSTFDAGSASRVVVHIEYLDISRSPDAKYERLHVDFLRQKYARRKVDLVIAYLPAALDFALKNRDRLFPGVPIVHLFLTPEELQARRLGPDVIGVPIKRDQVATLDLALRLHPETRRVFVIAGRTELDTYWAGQARQAFRPYAGRLEFEYLVGLPMQDLLRRVADLPTQSIIYYIHVFQDGAGKDYVPAEALELVAGAARAPIYGTFDTFVGRGIVGGPVVSFDMEGRNAAGLGLRILSGESPEKILVQNASANPYMFDWRQLRRWGISETSLPTGSEVRYRTPTLWDRYRWHILGVISFGIFETLLIVGLLLERASRMRAEVGLRKSQQELRALSNRLLAAHETESRRIARELHDDLSQGLALLSVEMDLLGENPPASAAQLSGRLRELLARVRQLSSTVHGLSHQLHPAKLEQLGLIAAVRGLCRELTQAHGLEIEFTHHQMPDAVSPDTALCVYRLVQESLRNAVKHSGAQRVTVDLTGSADAVSLRIVDDGAGFDPGLIQGKEGLGLVSMRERVIHLDGDITIDSRPSHGTLIDVRLPLVAAETERI